MNRYSSHAPKIELLSNGAVFVLFPRAFIRNHVEVAWPVIQSRPRQ